SRGYVSSTFNQEWALGMADNEATEAPFIREQSHLFHEISYAHAREVTLFNRWKPGLKTLIIGVAPKIMLGSLHSEIHHHSHLHDEGTSTTFEGRFSGDYAAFSEHVFHRDSPTAVPDDFFTSSTPLNINGIGFGMDIGLTYILPLGNDIALSPNTQRPLRKSIRFSLSVTDLGFIRYSGKTRSYSLETDENTAFNEPSEQRLPLPEYGHVLHQIMGHGLWTEAEIEADPSSYSVQLPTVLQLGTALQFHSVVALLDLNYRFHSYDFHSSGWGASVGLQLSPLSFLPVMASVKLDPERNLYYDLRAGIDFGLLTFSCSIRLFSYNDRQNALFAQSISTMGLLIRF
ncbi:DUF5723 family protein, partial [Balneolaceae bacterium ANBcel3]|nr:DUF5723 family protein [Balneolaceae bacterium ANBcel3]